MKGLVTKVATLTLLAMVLVAVPLVAACAKPAPAPDPTPVPAPASKSAASPAPASAPKANLLAQIIEGAKKEGALTLTLSTAHTPAQVIARMKKEIKDKYGVELELKVTAAGTFAQHLASAIMELKTGAPPGYDAMYMGADDTIYGQKEGLFEPVDWRPLLEPGTIAEVIPKAPEFSSGLIIWSGMSGLMYNPTKVKANELPKTLADLGDPKWKDRIGIMNYADYYARWAFIFGKDKMKSWIQAIMKNKPVIETMPGLNNRFVLGEVDIALISATYIKGNQARGAPSEWHPLDFVESRDFQIMVTKGARHPNAAKLFAVYMAGPDGVRLNIDTGKGNRFYSLGGLEYEHVAKAKQTGTFYTLDNSPELLKFSLSPDFDKIQGEFQLILKGQ